MLYKLAILGDGGVGKTALMTQVTLHHFPETYDPTLVDLYSTQVVIDNRECILEIIDAADQGENPTLGDYLIREGDGFVLVYSISSRASFNQIKAFYHQIQRVKSAHPKPIHSNSIHGETHNVAEAPTILIGNKADLVTEREISTQEGQALADTLGLEFMETSAKSAYNVKKAFFDVVRLLRHQEQQVTTQQPVTQPLPKGSTYRTRWFGIIRRYLFRKKN